MFCIYKNLLTVKAFSVRVCLRMECQQSPLVDLIAAASKDKRVSTERMVEALRQFFFFL